MSWKKFSFRLDSVLKLRKHETERARDELSQAAHKRQKQEADMQEAREHLDDVSRIEIPRGSIDPSKLRQMEAYRQEARARLARVQHELDRLKNGENEARVKLIHRRRDEEALQTLYEQQKEDHEREIEHTEAAFLDEQAINNHLRKQLDRKV